MPLAKRLRALQRVLDLVAGLDRTTKQWLVWRLVRLAELEGLTLRPDNG